MATPFSLSNHNRFRATINPTWPHPPEYNPTPAQTADRVARINREFAAIRDKLHADAAAEAARRAAESERLHREGGYFPGGNGYVTPRPGAWTPAMQAEVDNFSYNNPRPSPMTPNMAPLAPKRPSAREQDGMGGRGYTHEEVYGPGGRLDQQIAREQENERKRVEMQAGIDNLKASRPKSPRAPGPSALSAAQQAQMGQYGPPAAPAAPGSGGLPATPPTPSPAAGVAPPPPVFGGGKSNGGGASAGTPQAAFGGGQANGGGASSGAPRVGVPSQPREVAIAGGMTGNYRQAPIAAPPSYVPSNTQAHSGGIVERMQEPLPRPPVTQYQGTYQDAVNGLRQSVGYIPAPVQDPPSVITQPPTGVMGAPSAPLPSLGNFLGMGGNVPKNSQGYKPPLTSRRQAQAAPRSTPAIDQRIARMEAQYGDDIKKWPKHAVLTIVDAAPLAPPGFQPGLPFATGPGPDFPSQIPVTVPRQPLRRGGATLGDVANEYLVSAPGSIATGAQAMISDIQQLLKENKISREQYRELEAAIYARQAQERATQPQ